MRNTSKVWATVIGLVSFLLVLIVSPPAGLTLEAWYTAGLATAMAAFWIGQVMPLAVTSLLPLLVAPLLGISTIKTVGAQYGHPIIFLFLGGFVLGLAMERWRLHRRVALYLLIVFGQSPKKQLAAFMVTTALLSMWVSNTATAIMILPIALSVVGDSANDRDIPHSTHFAKTLLLGIAYSASIGGVATLIGTPPNALMAAYLQEQYAITVSFVGWMAMALPFSVLLLCACWLWLSRGLKPETVSSGDSDPVSASRKGLQHELQLLGPISSAELRVATIFMITALLWVCRPLINEAVFAGRLSDTAIALAAAVALHLVPAGGDSKGPIMDWSHTQRLPWGVLLLFGGGLALASLMNTSGLAQALAGMLEIAQHWPVIVLIFMVVGLIIFLTEVTSNTATTAVFLPLMGVLALSMELPPEVLIMPAAIAASCAFMLPVATPPNAIVFGADRLTVADMARTGLVLNLMAWVLISALGIWLL
ncbi:DASS family sodium-coupled anion symporter [Gilvimarinus sp. SDUM040013]|uniref:DASS family sodium-coupled anion symporter n=1 Tax=Gilvimarinus gilvus TaxID=3058038 RepID=A0ABU4S1A0_9GAMM|nr:DASS family sodium-coupled anion symporter [Gilvimarinus sp. SDUM040013]MDO3384646.1 DASS family sodium-coupled anion symporter [Gilvimarinus sp. SDUM040013]MDX6850232.1 DASS family sodium-coupled anion symporter [Gilvimarinus sp. SDUM040013]